MGDVLDKTIRCYLNSLVVNKSLLQRIMNLQLFKKYVLHGKKSEFLKPVLNRNIEPCST